MRWPVMSAKLTEARVFRRIFHIRQRYNDIYNQSRGIKFDHRDGASSGQHGGNDIFEVSFSSGKAS
jgi:hypothetical protein